MTDLPDRILIGPFTYEVERPTDIRNDGDRKLWGQIEYAKSKIRVLADVAPDRARETLFHECLHGISEAGAFGLSEKQVGQLSAAITDFLLRNPKVIALFQAESEAS